MAWYDLLGVGDLEASIGIAILLVVFAACYLFVDASRPFRYRLDWLLDSIYEDLLWYHDSELESADGVVIPVTFDIWTSDALSWKIIGRALGWSLKDIEMKSDTEPPQARHVSFGRGVNSGTTTVCEFLIAIQPFRNLLRIIPRPTRKRIIDELKFYWEECEGKCFKSGIVVKRDDGIHWIRILLEMRQQDIAARLEDADCSLPPCGFLLTVDHIHVECEDVPLGDPI